MDNTARKDYGLPASWMDRIFQRLGEIYGDKWPPHKDPNLVAILKTIWATSLADLNQHEIKKALDECRKNPSIIPDNLKFHRYAKGYAETPINRTCDTPKRTSDIATQTLQMIRNNLHNQLYKDTDNAANTAKDTKENKGE